MSTGRTPSGCPLLPALAWVVAVTLAFVPWAWGEVAEVWRGTVTSEAPDVEPVDVEVKLATGGKPVFAYDTRQGPREVELVEPGQTVRYVPPGGGVRTITVSGIDVSATRLRLVLGMTFEKTSGGVLEQTRGTSTTILVREGDTLLITLVVQTGTRLSDPELSAGGGDGEEITYSGVLRRHLP